jgi:lipoic acid synthetase
MVGSEWERRARLRPADAAPAQRLPSWLRRPLAPSAAAREVKRTLRELQLHTVCEEARCPNLPECFGQKTATFMILGEICTRACSFCAVTHGKPAPPDPHEPEHLASAAAALGLRHVVVTSVDRDDLPDRGAGHFVAVVRALRARLPGATLELLTPDFAGRIEQAVELLGPEPFDVFNHNLETVPRLYRRVRPGADYHRSLELLAAMKRRAPEKRTKSGIMLGHGETLDEVRRLMDDLRQHQVDDITFGQYLRPSLAHLEVAEYVRPEVFEQLHHEARARGFVHAASGPFVRSSYHAGDALQP